MLNFIETLIERIAIFVLSIQHDTTYDSMQSLSRWRYAIELNNMEHVIYGILIGLAIVLYIRIVIFIIHNVSNRLDEH